MTVVKRVVAALTTWAVASAGLAQGPVLDLRGVDPALSVEPTHIMVLGSSHLSAIEGASPDNLTPLLDRLAAYSPDVITIEAVPGETCEIIRAYPSEYPGVADNYCYDMSEQRAESGLTAAAGAARVRTLLNDWPAEPSASQRRELVAAFLAAAEPWSALVQWWRLDEGERRQGDGLGEKSVSFLTKLAGAMNESGQIGARLAARLKLERVFAADDHSSDIVIANEGSALWSRMTEIWPSKEASFKVKWAAADEGITNGKVVEAYRFYNEPETQLEAVDNDFRHAMNDSQAEQYGRKYNSWYQVRNLRMVASIVAAGATKPGGRVLSVVGASHKPYFEAYLDQMHDVRLVSTDTVLK